MLFPLNVSMARSPLATTISTRSSGCGDKSRQPRFLSSYPRELSRLPSRYCSRKIRVHTCGSRCIKEKSDSHFESSNTISLATSTAMINTRILGWAT